MPRVGRRRTKDQHLPLGVRPIGERLFWQPPTKRERNERKAAVLKGSVPLGPIVRLRGRIELTKAQRIKWAEVSGYRDEVETPGTIGELLHIFYEQGYVLKKRNGEPRASTTVRQYRWRRPALEARFAACRYARTETEVMLGRGTNAGQVQEFITASGSIGRAYLAILGHAFDVGILKNLTTYNPCDKVMAEPINARTREPLEWEMEVLGTLATQVLELILRAKSISGYRISEVLRIVRRDMNAEGIRFKVKGGKWETLLWSPGLRAIVAAAEALPTATKFPASPLFPHQRGKAYGYPGFYSAWKDLLTATNGELAAGVVDVEDLTSLHPAVQIANLHTHDIRSKVHDDAEDMGRPGNEQLGNTKAVARKHYARRERRRQPLF